MEEVKQESRRNLTDDELIQLLIENESNENNAMSKKTDISSQQIKQLLEEEEMHNNTDAKEEKVQTNVENKEACPEFQEPNKEQYMFHYAVDKPGMENIKKNEKETITSKIEDVTKNSKYYERQKEIYDHYEYYIQQRRNELCRLKSIPENVAIAQAKCSSLINKIKANRMLERTWLHVDMDMFYAAVETLDNPHLKDKPMAVGGMKMLSTSNYLARKYGIRSGMPGFIAKSLCPELIIVNCNFTRYKEISAQIKEIIVKYDKYFESYGLDEANLDVTDYLLEKGINNDEGKKEIAEEIRRKIFEKTKLTASCGVACNKILAKICANYKKPNSYYVLSSNETTIMQFLSDQEIRKVPYIGKKKQQILNGFGVFKLKDILEKAIDLYLIFDESEFVFYVESALGISRCLHDLESQAAPQKSISISQTYDKNLYQLYEFMEKYENLCKELEEKAMRKDMSGKLFSIEIKTADFKVIQKSHQYPYYINSSKQFIEVTQELLRQLWPCKPTRLLGVKLGLLTPNSEISDNDRSIGGNINKYAKKMSKEDIENERIKISNEIKKTSTLPNRKRMALATSKSPKKLKTATNYTLDSYLAKQKK